MTYEAWHERERYYLQQRGQGEQGGPWIVALTVRAAKPAAEGRER